MRTMLRAILRRALAALPEWSLGWIPVVLAALMLTAMIGGMWSVGLSLLVVFLGGAALLAWLTHPS